LEFVWSFLEFVRSLIGVCLEFVRSFLEFLEGKNLILSRIKTAGRIILVPGLPDGKFSYQNTQVGCTLEVCTRNGKYWYILGPFVHFMAIR
jgi:hypothetical protein